jgi:hypothetical protein
MERPFFQAAMVWTMATIRILCAFLDERILMAFSCGSKTALLDCSQNLKVRKDSTMKRQRATLLVFALGLFSFQISKAETINGAFEILDLSGEIRGQPELAADAARNSWQRACNEWKSETKELNKKNELIAINCESPSCTLLDSAKTECTSTGTYKIKTAGTRVNAPSEPSVVMTSPPAPAPVITAAPQPQPVTLEGPSVIVETIPAPRVGYLWVPGFWSWRWHHRVWSPGHWRDDRWHHYGRRW